MKNDFLFVLTAVSALVFGGCSENQKILEKYAEIKDQIENSDYEGLVNNLDIDSRTYLEIMTDTSQLNYDNIREKTKRYELEHYSVNYLFDFGSLENTFESKFNTIFLYYRISGIPLFDLFSEQRLLEDETTTGRENYVVVAKEVADKTYITKKVRFIKEDGEFKLDFLNLLRRRERDLEVAVERYRDTYIVNLPKEITENTLIDSTRLRDYLYTYMHFSRKDELTPDRYYYKSNAARKK